MRLDASFFWFAVMRLSLDHIACRPGSSAQECLSIILIGAGPSHARRAMIALLPGAPGTGAPAVEGERARGAQVQSFTSSHIENLPV